MFYTYLWLRYDGTPYYVGKGSKDRAFTNCGHLVNRPSTDEFILVQLHESEADAFEAEKFLIAHYGRSDLKTGCLRNLTNGGEGAGGEASAKGGRTQGMRNANKQGYMAAIARRPRRPRSAAHRRALGRSRSKFIGEAACNVKLTENDVRELRTLRGQGNTYGELMRRFAISKTQVADIANRRSWRHL